MENKNEIYAVLAGEAVPEKAKFEGGVNNG
jgi:hypothetical protein